jgi:hypothetical protein
MNDFIVENPIWRLTVTMFSYYGKKTDEALVEEYTKKLSMKLDGYEAILSKQKYLAGEVGELINSQMRFSTIDRHIPGTHHG